MSLGEKKIERKTAKKLCGLGVVSGLGVVNVKGLVSWLKVERRLGIVR